MSITYRWNVLVAGEREELVKAVSVILKRREEVFYVCHTCRLSELSEEATRHQPEVIVICCERVEEEIRELAVTVKQKAAGSQVVVVTGICDHITAYRLQQQGVGGVLSYRMLPAGLLGAIELICQAGVFCYTTGMLAAHGGGAGGDFAALKKGSRLAGAGNEEVAAGCAAGNCPLTPRELEVFRLMAANCSNRDIAQKLYITEPTVKTHISSILRKLGQPNRTQAILYGLKTGLISMESVAGGTNEVNRY